MKPAYLIAVCIVFAGLGWAGAVELLAQDATAIPIVAYLNDPTADFDLPPEGRDIVGTIIHDPALMDYWKIEIRGGSRSFVGGRIEDRVLANDWLTVESIRRDSVIEGVLYRLPGYPTLSTGDWRLRLVAVGYDGNALVNIELPFTVLFPDTDPVPVEITQPVEGQVLRANAPVTGTVLMNQFASAYELQLLGGSFTDWTTISGPFANDVAQPTRITNGQIGLLPDINSLPPGQYRLRLVVKGLDANYLQAPREVQFAVRDAGVSNLPSVAISAPRVNNGVITLEAPAPLVGTVTVPEGASFYKLEIKDDPSARSQTPLFTDWTMLGATHAESVADGQIEMLPGPDQVPVGDYLLRVVIVNPDGAFSGEPYEVKFRLRQEEEVDLTNTSAAQASGGSAEWPAVITQPRLNIRANGDVQVPRQQADQPLQVLGTVVVPPDGSYWKLEVLGGVYTDWTTIGDTRTDSIVDGELMTIPGGALARGDYRLRLVIVAPDSNFVGTSFELPFTLTA